MRKIDADRMEVQVKEALGKSTPAMANLLLMWVRQQPTVNDSEIVHCVDCKRKYFKDFSAYCPYRFGALKPDGFCECGERESDG